STIAYVSQESWLLNDSLRENILFGSKFDHEKYEKVIEMCALQDDVNQLPHSHQTEIGEKGVNLSCGQKQRIALARALYSEPDVLILDDPLTAVDSSTARHIFNKAWGHNTALS